MQPKALEALASYQLSTSVYTFAPSNVIITVQKACFASQCHVSRPLLSLILYALLPLSHVLIDS